MISLDLLSTSSITCFNQLVINLFHNIINIAALVLENI